MRKADKIAQRSHLVTLVRRYGELDAGTRKDDVFQEFQTELDKLLGIPAVKRPPGFANASKEVQAWATEVMVATDAAIREFGRYTFADKGPSEVMPIKSYADDLRTMLPVDAGARLEALAVCGRDYEKVACDILTDLDDADEDWWDLCIAACPTVRY